MVLTEPVTDRLATRNVQDVTREFADLVEDGELLGLGFVAVATDGGRDLVTVENPQPDTRAGVRRTPPAAA